ncbi:hypothetical protein E3P98_03895 [Wallemia ichthyophaga]|nr:hypothetical protein E3P98_03895 [Wallemia ichthyophaga]
MDFLEAWKLDRSHLDPSPVHLHSPTDQADSQPSPSYSHSLIPVPVTQPKHKKKNTLSNAFHRIDALHEYQPIPAAVIGRGTTTSKALFLTDWRVAFNDVKYAKVVRRIGNLQALRARDADADTAKQDEEEDGGVGVAGGGWSFKQPKKHRGVAVPLAHWDHLLDQVGWLQADFKAERRWKLSVAFLLASKVAEWHSAGHDGKKALCVNASIPQKSLLKRREQDEHEREEQEQQTEMLPIDSEMEVNDAINEHVGGVTGEKDEENETGRGMVDDNMAGRILRQQEEEQVQEQEQDATALKNSHTHTDLPMDIDELTRPPTLEQDIREEEEGGDTGSSAQSGHSMYSGQSQSTHTSTTTNTHTTTPHKDIIEARKPLLEGEMRVMADMSEMSGGEVSDLSELFPDLPTYTATASATAPQSMRAPVHTAKVERGVGAATATALSGNGNENGRVDTSSAQAGRVAHVSRLMQYKTMLVSSLEPGKHRARSAWDVDTFDNYTHTLDGVMEGGNVGASAGTGASDLFHGKKTKSGSANTCWENRPEGSPAIGLQWSEEEDNLLHTLTQQYTGNWLLVADIFNGSHQAFSHRPADRREPVDCFERWKSGEGREKERDKEREREKEKEREREKEREKDKDKDVKETTKKTKDTKKKQLPSDQSRRAQRRSHLVTLIGKSVKKREKEMSKREGQAKRVSLFAHETHATDVTRLQLDPVVMSTLKLERDRQVQAELVRRQQAAAYRQAQAFLMKGGNPRMLPPNHPVAIAAAAVARGGGVGEGGQAGQAGQAGQVHQVPQTAQSTQPFNSPQLQQAALMGANNANLPPQLQQQVRAMGNGGGGQ